MGEPRKHTLALTTVIQSVFPKRPCQSVARRSCDRSNTEVRSESLAVTRSALLPLRRCIVRLADAGGESGTHNWIGSKRLKDVAVKFRFRRRGGVCDAWLRWCCNCNHAGRVTQIGDCLRICRPRQGHQDHERKHDKAHVHVEILSDDFLPVLAEPTVLIPSGDMLHGRTGKRSQLLWIPLLYTPDRSIFHQVGSCICREGGHICCSHSSSLLFSLY